MKEVLTKELTPTATAESSGAGGKARENHLNQTAEVPDCTLEQLELRSNTETTVLKRILHFPLHA
jgi:hypothetical protein